MIPEPLSAEERAWMAKRQRLWPDEVARYDATVRQAEQRAEQAEAERDALREEVARLRAAIETVLADEETGEGWGPDVTMAAVLRAALQGEEPTDA